MKTFHIQFEDCNVLVKHQGNNGFELFFKDELVAIIRPQFIGNEVKWLSDHIETSQAKVIGSLIAAQLLQ